MATLAACCMRLSKFTNLWSAPSSPARLNALEKDGPNHRTDQRRGGQLNFHYDVVKAVAKVRARSVVVVEDVFVFKVTTVTVFLNAEPLIRPTTP